MAFKGSFRAYVVLAILTQSTAVGLVVPVLPRLLEKFALGADYGVSTIYGWTISIFAIAMFACSPLMGRLSDRFGRRPIVLLSFAAAIIDYSIAALTSHLWVFLVARVISGILAAGGAAMWASIADATPPEERAKAFSLVGAAAGAGFIIGPPIGGFLNEEGPAVVFWVASGMFAVDLVLGWLLYKETLPESSRRPLVASSFNPVTSLRAIGRFHLGTMLTVFLIAHAGLAFADPIGVLFMQARWNWSAAQIGVFTAISAAGGVIARLTLTPFAVAKLGERRTILLGLASLAAGMVLYEVITQSWQMYGVLCFILLGSVTIPTLIAAISRAVPASDQGELQGGLVSIQWAANAVGAPVGAAAFAYFIGPSAPFVLYAAPFLLCAAFLIIAFFALWRSPSAATQTAPGAALRVEN